MPVGNAAPPRPRRPDSRTSVTVAGLPISSARIDQPDPRKSEALL
jgi:hypothetical protein